MGCRSHVLLCFICKWQFKSSDQTKSANAKFVQKLKINGLFWNLLLTNIVLHLFILWQPFPYDLQGGGRREGWKPMYNKKASHCAFTWNMYHETKLNSGKTCNFEQNFMRRKEEKKDCGANVDSAGSDGGRNWWDDPGGWPGWGWKGQTLMTLIVKNVWPRLRGKTYYDKLFRKVFVAVLYLNSHQINDFISDRKLLCRFASQNLRPWWATRQRPNFQTPHCRPPLISGAPDLGQKSPSLVSHPYSYPSTRKAKH